jgi:hypothetical protein
MLPTTPSWPTPPVADAPEPLFVLDLPYDHVRVFLPGLKFAIASVFHWDNSWGQQLRAVVPGERLRAARRVLEAFEDVPLEQPFILRLHLPDAAELHLAAHLGALTTVHDVWNQILRHLNHPAALPEPELPPGVSPPPTDPNARTMRQEVAMVSGNLAKYVEEVFGEDAPALVANRKLVTQLTEDW